MSSNWGAISPVTSGSRDFSVWNLFIRIGVRQTLLKTFLYLSSALALFIAVFGLVQLLSGVAALHVLPQGEASGPSSRASESGPCFRWALAGYHPCCGQTLVHSL